MLQPPSPMRHSVKPTVCSQTFKCQEWMDLPYNTKWLGCDLLCQ